ncbi:MAG: type IA DNA topoisomerase, partial [Lachnospiraceae bacterium]|nr:type IA DNA topoisomerase [Lachnospiraceae bacterium]
QHYPPVASYASKLLSQERFRRIAKTRYVNDKQITDHYAIIPTGQGLSALNSLHPVSSKVYEIIVRRFLSIFYPAAVYQKITLTAKLRDETFISGFKVQAEQGYLEVAQNSFARKRAEEYTGEERNEEDQQGALTDADFMQALGALKKGSVLEKKALEKKEGETSPPKRYNSGTMILTMENAGQFIEDEELRAQIKGSGIGTSATRAEILKKLVHIKYLNLNKKTQIITPTLLGEMIYEVVAGSIKPLLDPRLTASWEKGLTLVATGEITKEEYMGKLDDFVTRRTNTVKQMSNQNALYHRFQYASQFYKGVKKDKG